MLKPEVAAVVDAERFLDKINTTAKLHHPYTLPLFRTLRVDERTDFRKADVEPMTASPPSPTPNSDDSRSSVAKVEAELLVTKERLARLVETSPAVIYSSRPSGDFGATYISPNVRDQVGYEPEAFTQDSDFWASKIHPDDRERIFGGLSALFEAGHHTHEYRFLHADGAHRWMRDELRLVRDEHGEPLEIVGYWIDITERMVAEEALRKSEQNLRSMIEGSSDGVVVLTEGQIVCSNSAAAKMLGHTPEEILGKSPLDFVHPDDRDRAAERMAALISGGIDDADTESRTYRSLGSGGVFPGEVVSTPITFEGKQAILATVRDITERREAEERQKLLVQELDHRVKNTLAAILGLVRQTARSAGSIDSFVATFTSRVHAMSEVHIALAREHWGDISVAEIFRIAAGEITQDLVTDRCSIEGEASWNVPATMAMPLAQALHELVVNAMKYGSLSTPDGRVSVRCESSDDGSLVLQWTESGGPELSRDVQSGMGLTLVTGLIEHQLGGEVRLDFPSSGARHELRVPGAQRP